MARLAGSVRPAGQPGHGSDRGAHHDGVGALVQLVEPVHNCGQFRTQVGSGDNEASRNKNKEARVRDGDKLDKLRAEGYALDMLSDEQLDILRDLSDNELGVLIEVGHRLAAEEPEVTAHAPMTIGGLFF